MALQAKEATRPRAQHHSRLVPKKMAEAAIIDGTGKEVTEVITRIPYATLNDIPEDLRGVIESSRGMVDDEMFIELVREAAIDHYTKVFATEGSDSVIAELEDEKLGTAAMKRKTAYAGALWSQAGQYSSATTGAYNPDKTTYTTYEKMQHDGQIALALSLIKKPIEHVNISVECTNTKIKSLVEWSMDKMYIRLVADLLMGINMGHACLEKNWKKINRLRLVSTDDKSVIEAEPGDGNDAIYDEAALLMVPTIIHPGAYNILLDKLGDLTGIAVKVQPSSEAIKIKRSKLIFYTHNMQYGNWYGISRMKPAYPWWYWSQIVLQFMIRYLERKSSPPIVVRAPIGNVIDSTGKQISALALGLKIGNGLTSNSVGVLPNVYDKNGKPMWDVNYLMDDQRMNMFIEVLALCNTMTMRSMLVPDNVATQSGTGSFSQSDAHSDIHLMNEEALLREIQNIINTQVVPWIVKYNFPPEERVKCTVQIEKLTLSRKQLLKEIFQKTIGVVNQMIRDGAMPLVLPDMSSIAKALEIPMSETEGLFDMTNWTPGGKGVFPGDSTGTDPVNADEIVKDEKQKDNNKERETVRSPRDRNQRRGKIA